MKNKIIIYGFLLIAFVCIIALIYNSKQIHVKTFDLNDYQCEVEEFQLDINVGEVTNAKIAIEKAKELWIKKYGARNNGEIYDYVRRKIEVSFDSENECWLINGTLPHRSIGFVPYALIQKDGKVLAVWKG